jgi:hypothetical protein
MKDELSSVQRRLLKEQDEIELDVPDEVPAKPASKPVPKLAPPVAKVPAPEKPEPKPENTAEADLNKMPIEGDKEPEPKSELDGKDTAENTRLLTKAIDELNDIRTNLNKKGLLIAMHMSDFSTQRRLQALSDELGNIINHLNEKILKTASKSPTDMERATEWLSGEIEDETQHTT